MAAPDLAPPLRQLRDQLAPVTLPQEQLLDVPAPLRTLFPHGGLQRGTSVGFAGPGSTSVALAVAAAALGDDRWMAVVGVEELGLLAAAELGVRLDRLLVVSETGSDRLATVIAALLDAVDIVALDPRRPIGGRAARRLTARARERGTVLFHLDGGRSWPEAVSLTLTARPEGWTGLGAGHGHLQHRRMSITAGGRRSSARPRRTTVLLPGPGGACVEAPALLQLAQ